MSNECLSYSMIIDKKAIKSNILKINEKKIKYIPVNSRRINFWVEDKLISNCYNCNLEFSIFQRKHHCRYCGRIFCNNCSKDRIKFPDFINVSKDLNRNNSYIDNLYSKNDEKRVCKSCNSYLLLKIKNKDLFKIFNLIKLDMKDYYNIGLVSKKWRNIFLDYFSYIRELQYKIP